MSLEVLEPAEGHAAKDATETAEAAEASETLEPAAEATRPDRVDAGKASAPASEAEHAEQAELATPQTETTAVPAEEAPVRQTGLGWLYASTVAAAAALRSSPMRGARSLAERLRSRAGEPAESGETPAAPVSASQGAEAPELLRARQRAERAAQRPPPAGLEQYPAADGEEEAEEEEVEEDASTASPGKTETAAVAAKAASPSQQKAALAGSSEKDKASPKTSATLPVQAAEAAEDEAPKSQKANSQKKAEPESSEPKKKPGRKPKQEAQAEEPSKRAAEEPAPEERSKKKTKTTAVDVHLEALRSLKTEAEREEYLGNITLTMRMKVAEAQSMCADALPAAEVEEEAPAPSEKPKEKKRGKAAKPEAALPEPDEAAEAPAPSGRPQKRAAAQQAEPEEAKKPKKLTAAVEKHMDELAKLKTQKQKEKYIAKLTISMQTKVAAALSEAEVQEETEEPESKKRAAPAKEPKDSAKARKVDDSEKHVEELSKLKSEKAKTAYLKQRLLPSVRLSPPRLSFLQFSLVRSSFRILGMNTPIDERETLDGFAAEDVSPISAGLLREAGGDIDMQEAAQAALRAALDRDGGGGVRERGAGTGMKEALQDADTEAAAATRRLFEKKNPRNSPEKKARPEVPSAASAKVGAPGLQAPPVFGGPRPPPKDKRSLPDAYDISDAAPPPWAQDLQHSLMRTEAFEARLSALENEVALGGWYEAKREAIEEEVRAWFSRAECLPLLQVQNLCVEALRAAARTSDIPGQQGGTLWAKRNRSPEERARIRAIVSLKALVSQHLSARDFEFDWRGRFWTRGYSVLAHVDAKKPTDGALLLLDARGSETGWWIPGPEVARHLGIDVEKVHQHFEVDTRTGDAETVWKDTLEGLDLELAPANPEDVIMIGADVNQDLRAVVDEFSGVGHLRALIAKYDLVYNRSLGATWSARGCESEIDFVMVRAARISLAAHKREDMRDALPSDHSPVFAVLHTPLPLVTRSQRPITKCGRWLVDGLVLQAYAEEGKPFEPEEFKNLCASHARRLPSLRYRDSQELKATIALRRQETDTQVKAALLQRIRHERAVAKNEHRIRILEEARGGDRRAISYLRKSAAHASFEVSYIQQRGGELAASQELQAFYEAKYTSFLPAPTEDSINTMIATHQFVQPRRFTQDELEAAIERCKARTSAGMDGVCYEAIKAYHRGDVEGRLLEFFNGLLFRKVPVPDDWKRAKVVLLLMLRISEQCPPFQSGQLGCRKGTQTVDGVLAAQTVIGVLRKKHGVEAHAAKLDIRAAFDSLSHSALVQYIMACKPCPEACHLWDLCSANTLHMSLGAASWEVNVHQGILQGSSYSADVFARVIDYHLRGLHERWNSKFPKWDDGVGLPHFLLYADDLLVFAMSPAELQSKLHDITDSLQAIGLFINAGKCSVLNVQGSTPGVWTRNSCRPLAGKDSLVFLGVPLSHTNNPDTMLMHSLRKMTNSYFAMKKVLDHATTSHRVRLTRLLHETDLLGKTFTTPKKVPQRITSLDNPGIRRLEAEARALTVLNEDDFVTKEHVAEAVNLIPATEWGARYGGRVLSFGAYQRVSNGLRTCCKRYPILTRLLTRFVTQWCPSLKFTTLTIMLNVNSPPHTDAGNSEVPGMLLALTTNFTGGELWIEHEYGTHTKYRNGVPFKGVQVDLASPFVFSAKRVLHGTCRWEGTRMVLAAYSTANSATNLSQEVSFRLSSLGFALPTHADEDRFRFEIWGATITLLAQSEPVILLITRSYTMMPLGYLLAAPVVGLLFGIFLALRRMQRDTKALRIQMESVAENLTTLAQMATGLHEIRGEIQLLKRSSADALDSLYHGLELRQRMGVIDNTYDIVRELHSRRADVMEVSHASFLRAQLQAALNQLQALENRLAALEQGHQGEPLPIVRLAVPEGTQLHLI
ncbi:pol [Symbiodinium microadriaticum]|nr:pol [Symbiodinium microadriaticum]